MFPDRTTRSTKRTTVFMVSLIIILVIFSYNQSIFSQKETFSFITPTKLKFPGVKIFSNFTNILTFPNKMQNSEYPKIKNNKFAENESLGVGYEQVEDIFCLQRPKTLRNYKNPCWRDADETLRCLPYFHLGTSKCGSTDLFHRVKQHPDVLGCSGCIGNGKETMYWAWERYGYMPDQEQSRPKMTFSQYTDKFDEAAQEIQRETTHGYHDKIIGDGSPMDFWDFRGWTQIPQNRGLAEPEVLTPHLMRHVFTDFKMVLILRDPVDRLYSDYHFLLRRVSRWTFHTHAVKSINMMRKCLSNNSVAACFFSHDLFKKLPTRIHIGCYSVFLKVWLSVFPREKFLFLRTEDYKYSTKKTLLEVFDFLNLRPMKVDDIDDLFKSERKKVTLTKKTAGPMLKRTRTLLNNFYAQYNTELASMLEDDRFLWPKRG